MNRRELGFEQWIAPLILVLLHALLYSYGFGEALRGRADFSNFFSTALLVRNGQAEHIYDARVQQQLQARLFPQAQARGGPLLLYMHPPFEALLFLPLTYLGYPHAYLCWLLFNLSVLLLLPHLLAACVPELAARFRPYLLLGFLAYFPASVALLQGQDSILLLLLFALAYRSLQSGNDYHAGVLLGLGLFRYQIVGPFALLYFAQKRWKVVLGFAAVAALLFLVCLKLVGWSGTAGYIEYLRELNGNLDVGANMQERGFFPQDMPNLRGFLFLIFSGTLLEKHLLAVTALTSVLLLVWSLKRGRNSNCRSGTELPFALQLIVALLVSFHLYTHDLSLLALAVVLLFNEFAVRQPKEKIALLSWPILTAIFYFSPIYLLLLHFHRVSLLFVPLLLLAIAVSISISKQKRADGEVSTPC